MTYADEALMAAGPKTRHVAKPEHGAVPFDSLPLNARFFFAGQFTRSNVKLGPYRYRAPFAAWDAFTGPDTLVYPDPSVYVG